ncbi:hypothetical protein [Inquilinus sp. CAU 1745]|uniref:hypothetical protein n=1 Tax=Inquilinus sp. CAU 1745 TaxID=3140369 RepID=UPI00325BB76B
MFMIALGLLAAPGSVAQAQTQAGTQAGAQSADPFADWTIQGDVFMRAEHYGDNGDRNLSPYPYVGPQNYLELNATAERAFSPWNRLTFSIFGLANDSDYRSLYDNLSVESFNLTWENGEASVPFRLGLGDYFGNLTGRTLRRSLKGGYIELQPFVGDQTHSILLFSGTPAQAYREFNPAEDLYSGGSYLIDDPVWGAWAFSAVHNRRELDDGATADQTVLSLAGEQSLNAGGQSLTLETELDFLRGEQDGGSGNGSGAGLSGDSGDRSGLGFYAELFGRDDIRPLTYGLRYELNDEGYRPAGAGVVEDREAMEARAGWRFDSGLSVNGRVLRLVDDRTSDNPMETRTAGVTVVGFVPVGGFGSVSVFANSLASQRRNEDRTTDEFTLSQQIDLTFPLGDVWTASVGGGYRSMDDRNADQRITRELSADLIRSVEFGGWAGSWSVGLVGRDISGGSAASDQYGGRLGLNIGRDAHRLDASYELLLQDAHAAGGQGSFVQTAGLAYSYTMGQHSFGVDAVYNDRDQDPGGEAGAHRIGLFYRYSFFKPPAPRSPAMNAAMGAAAAGPIAGPSGAPPDILALAPGLDLSETIDLLSAGGLGEPVRFGTARVWDVRMLEDAPQRQRLVLIEDSGQIATSAVIVDFDGLGSGRPAERAFERILDDLIDRYGAPSRTFEDGVFADDFVAAVNAQRLVRVYEWETAQGTLRFGIPRRLDGQVRMELHYAAGFPPPGATRWSIEAVR